MRFTQEYEAYCSAFTDAPEIFHRFVSYYLISCAMGRKVHMEMGHTRLYPNIWIVVVAPSSLYHKSTAVGIGQEILNRAMPDFMFPDDYSYESLMVTLQERAQGAFFYDEAAGFFNALGRDYNKNTRELFTKLYSGLSHTAVFGTKPETRRKIHVSDPYINFIGASTLPWLVESVSNSSIVGGFLPRFLLVSAQDNNRVMAFQPKHDQSKYNSLVSKLAIMNQSTEGEMTYAPDAKRAYEAFYNEEIEKYKPKPHKIQGFLFRLLNPMTHKLAMIISVDRGEFPTVSLGAFTEAKLAVQGVARRLEDSIIDELGSSHIQRVTSRVYRLITTGNGHGVNAREIYRALTISKFEFTAAIDTLTASGQITMNEIRHDSGGRPSIFYSANHD